jgi:hypothetical protein
MKNIYIIPTDKPSRLALLHDDKLHIGTSWKKDFNVNPQNIYITSDEEIEDGDWFYLDDAQIIAKYIASKPVNEAKKIILTTDPSLDGVQAINDKFLEWFCSKNGKVDFVEIIEIENEKNK